MTSLLARILLSIMVLPLAALVYILLIFGFMRQSGPWGRELGFLTTTLITAGFVVGYWLWLWRGSVRWTPQRLGLTLGSGLAATFVGLITGGLMMAVVGNGNGEFGIFIGGVTGIVVWLPMTVVLWRETAEERAERIRQAAGDVLFCPRCGYNLTGLREARCPECGAQFTIDQLFAAQRRDVMEERKGE